MQLWLQDNGPGIVSFSSRSLNIFFLFLFRCVSLSSASFPSASLPLTVRMPITSCSVDAQCAALYRGLELCAADAVMSSLVEQAASECLERRDVLLSKHPSLLTCKCQRGFRKEEQCLRGSTEGSPSGTGIEPPTSRSEDDPLPPEPRSPTNQCLKAAQDCGLYEKCGSLRSEYVLACTKRAPGSHRCNQHKCYRALRRFLERVPEEYSLGVLFCPCTNTLCGERRRKTIVPSCSYQDMEGLQPNCLHQQSFCRRDDLCRSRLADFLNNCQPSHLTASGCLKDSAGLCLRAYAGLIGTIMTPNYISNSSADVSLWCTCEGSGNQWQECQRLQRLFTHNACLREMGQDVTESDFQPTANVIVIAGFQPIEGSNSDILQQNTTNWNTLILVQHISPSTAQPNTQIYFEPK
uniref:GDNF family receptor alpha 3 n=1 Tax=Gouania willdenowi TaxID=441366 RepID=A0A8C5GR64_GOUWI